MKTACALSLSYLLLTIGVARANRITEVTVYTDRAQVTRTAEFDLKAGDQDLEIGPLPVTLDDNSVRATGKASVPVTIQNVAIRHRVRTEIRDPDLAQLEQHLTELRDQRAGLDARQRVLDQQREFLKQIQIKAAGDATRDIQLNKFDLAQLRDLPAWVAEELMRVEEATAKLNRERRELDRQIASLQVEFEKRRAAASRAEKSVVVTVQAPSATKFTLQVTYVVPQAGWSPVFDARARTDLSGVDLTYFGTVRQQTGEDWRGVNLTLSTARPAVAARMPELQKWVLDFTPPMPVVSTTREGLRRAIPMAELQYAVPDDKAAREVEALLPSVDVESGVTAVSFRVPRAADVPADGQPHRQSIQQLNLPASFVYETTPKLSPFAYLKAAVTNTSDAPLLAGAVNVFLGPDFVGTSRIDTVAPTEAFDLYLGIDEAIRVKREELKDKSGRTGIFRNRQRRVFAYKITVENYKERPIRLLVYDQIPVSAHDDIKVTPGETLPTLDKDTGKLTWTLDLKPREKRELTFDFTVEWPQDKPIPGF
ncbi:MAG: mucoidy inhibitor MuiA family protein [Verrucomicrobiae bacterium]|nr:mucoidy inhibitor MuiA family protein [Verrucomicrobiae bacterium]